MTSEERRSLASLCEAIVARPAWVDGWDIVCVTDDWRPDNLGMREPDGEMVYFDWGTTRLGPMEEDLAVLLGRIEAVGSDRIHRLLVHYLTAYNAATGRSISADTFLARVPWARLLAILRGMLDHMRALRWVRWQSRSQHMVHVLIREGARVLSDCRTR